jgi:ABC-2 type transport system permease protein
MKLLTVFLKTWREMRRDPLMLGLSLAFAPVFVLLYWIMTAGGSTSYTVLVINQDQGAQLANGSELAAGQGAIQAISDVRYADGKPLLKVRLLDDPTQIDNILRNREAVAFVRLPEDFSQTVLALRSGDRTASPRVRFGGDLTNPYYTLGATLSLGAVESYVAQISGQPSLLQYSEEPLGGSAARTEFETYVPGQFVFAVILLIFLAAMTVAREVESGTLRRLRLSCMNSFHLLGGITAALVLIGVIAMLLAFGTAVAVGFRSQGPLWVAILIAAVTSLAVIGAGMIVACFSRSVAQAFVIANFPLGVLMAFSGVMFPMPKVPLFNLGPYTVSLYDFLPTTHAVTALSKILTLGAGFSEVVYELTALVILSGLYFAVGVWLFQKRHLR